MNKKQRDCSVCSPFLANETHVTCPRISSLYLWLSKQGVPQLYPAYGVNITSIMADEEEAGSLDKGSRIRLWNPQVDTSCLHLHPQYHQCPGLVDGYHMVPSGQRAGSHFSALESPEMKPIWLAGVDSWHFDRSLY